MDYRNKLGVFTFDNDVQESHMKLVVQNVTGQYLNPKPGERALTDEESCYEYILNYCGNVLARIGFDLAISEDVRIYTPAQLRAKKIQDFDARMAAYVAMDSSRLLTNLLDEEDRKTQVPSYSGWLVGPASLVGR